MDLKQRIESSFCTYAAMAIQHRAIVDVRDCLKPAQRMAMYSQVLDKITYKKPHKKTHASIISAMQHFYVHGDAPMAQVVCRMGSNISMRYPIEDTIGNMGTYAHLDDFAAPRYTEMRLGEMGTRMVEGIDKESIDVWFDNYDNTEKFPSVLPSLGYYNIVNGTTGIAVAMASSIPQFNLREVNEALIKLLWNPDIDFDEIYCAPDFATGGTILNANEVKESLRVGHGKSVIIRGDVEYDSTEHKLQVTAVPYGVATDNIKKQIGKMFNPDPEDKKPIPSTACAGIKRFTDSSEEIVDISVWLEKGANVNNVIKNLYKYTSIQSYFPINLTMLDNGTNPKVFGWKEALQSHLNHEIKVRKKIHEYNIKKIDERLPIVEAIVLALANVDEVVSLIRSSKNTSEAKAKLIERFSYTDAQAKAVVDIKLGRLATLEIQSFNDEKEELTKSRDYSVLALSDNNVLYKEIEKDLREVADKFGDNRRTVLKNLDYKGKDDDVEPIEKKELIIYYTNLGNIYTVESSTLMKSRRGTKGKKIKLADNEVITKIISDNNFSDLYAFTASGNMCTVSLDELPLDTKVNLSQLLNLEIGDKVTTLVSLASRQKKKNFIFITKKGMIKKSETSLYNIKRGKTMKAIKLKEGDEVVNVMLMDEGEVGILSSSGCFVKISINDITPIGKIAMGVKAIALKEGEYVIDAKEIKSSDKYLITLSKNGIVKKTSIEDFAVTNRATHGKQVSGVRDNDTIIKILTIEKDCDIIIIVNKRSIKISTSEIPELSRTATGVKGINLTSGETALDVVVSSEE